MPYLAGCDPWKLGQDQFPWQPDGQVREKITQRQSHT